MSTPRNVTILVLYLAAIAAVPAAEPLAEWSLKIEFPDDTVRIRYNPALATPVNKTFDPGAGWDMHEVITTKLAPDSDDVFLIIFDPGPSADPNFQVVRGTEPTDNAYLGSINGLELVIPGDGFVYVSGHTDTTFDQRRKYRVTNEGVEEVPQPYYYVGLSTKTLKPVTLRSALEGGETVAELPAGSDVEILLNHEDDYLIKTPEGLVGWFTEKLSTQEPEHFEGLYFRGD